MDEVKLTEREKTTLNAIEKLISYWTTEVEKLNYAGRDENARDMAISVLRQLDDIRVLLLAEYDLN